MQEELPTVWATSKSKMCNSKKNHLSGDPVGRKSEHKALLHNIEFGQHDPDSSHKVELAWQRI